ncbi:unnamed protein product [Clonostachys chloroleuca]|uniref:Uncharacterized protein n=1 Tax=Clonostachys chloroleuca TaxID=1926264 RepID=A0AA35M568_9HYPO|nr:unnamed protein product [Clonostachys chloroleuca]
MKSASGDAPPSQDSKPSSMQYTWMFEGNNAPTKQLDALLRAIAHHIFVIEHCRPPSLVCFLEPPTWLPANGNFVSDARDR